MLIEKKKKIIDEILASFSRDEVLFSAGYLSASVRNWVEAPVTMDLKLTILYVSETGNSKFLAFEVAKMLKKNGAKVKVKSAEQYSFAEIEREKNLLFVTSTHGEGEVPEAGLSFLKHLRAGVDLKGLNYFVVALGDRNYPLFCQAGKEFDEVFAQNGAKKLAQNFELDLDFEDFVEEVAKRTEILFGGEKEAPLVAKKLTAKSEFVGEVVENIDLNDEGSLSETRHIEIAVDGEIDYQPGDAIGILLDGKEVGVDESLAPRLYSVASAPGEHEGFVHILVKVLRYENQDGKEVEGLFSSYLSRLEKGAKVSFYVAKNRNFKLPGAEKDVIMIGAGTGVAPFRSFLAQRNYQGDSGKNWLFFGERNFRTDFLYQTEMQDHLKSGLLTRIDTAFSRDGKDKRYVQDRILQNAKEFAAWALAGAVIYVCGDKKGMARGVEAAVLEVVGEEEFVKLKEEGRYLVDVY